MLGKRSIIVPLLVVPRKDLLRRPGLGVREGNWRQFRRYYEDNRISRLSSGAALKPPLYRTSNRYVNAIGV